MSKNYDLIYHKIRKKYKQYSEDYIDKLIYQLDVEGLLFKHIPYGGWSLYLIDDILLEINKKIDKDLERSKKRLLFHMIAYSKKSIIKDNDIILLSFGI